MGPNYGAEQAEQTIDNEGFRMTGTQLVTLAAAVIALLGSVLSLLISTSLAVHKERRQLLWSKELDRLFELEEMAGELVEELGSHRQFPADPTAMMNKLWALELAAGRFGRYPDVRQAIRSLTNVLHRMFVSKRDQADSERVRAELEPAYQKLLKACDNVVGRK